MKSITTLLFICLTLNAWSDSTSNDFGSHSGKVVNLSEENLREQLSIEGNIYVLDESGDKLLFEAREERTWKFSKTGDLISHWSYKADRVDPIAIKHHWKIDKQGRIHVAISQYTKMTKGSKGGSPRLGKLIREKNFVLSNFEPIVWKVRADSKGTVVARLTPRLTKTNPPQQVGKIPISGKNLIAADNKGFVWTPDASFSGQYISLKTNRGTVHLSYLPFRGAKEIGFAKENKIKVEIGKKHRLMLINSAPLLPYGIEAKVYGMVNLKSKSRPGSTHIISSDQEKEFLSSIK